VSELEGIDLDFRASRDQVEKLKATCSEWSKLLGAHEAPLPESTYGAALARSILRKIRVSPIVVPPVREDVELRALCQGEPAPIPAVISWRFRGVSRFDHAISGGPAKGEVRVDANYWMLCEEYGLKPIAGGSGDVTSDGQYLDGPPKPPALGDRPGEPGRPSKLLRDPEPRRAAFTRECTAAVPIEGRIKSR
jgi:hypothetical protein